MSFLPDPFKHPYEIADTYQESVAYFSMEFALDQALKTYSGGLGFLSGSHMRSAFELKQNLIGISILWTYGYYDQARDENREMAVAHRKKIYHFLKDTGLTFPITIHGSQVWVKALYLPAEVFDTAPIFFLTTDIDENDYISRTISHNLYANDKLTRISQNMLLGIGGAKLMELLQVDPDVWHLNEAHGLAAVFHEASKSSLAAVRDKFVFTTHTPEDAGNERSSRTLLRSFDFFSQISDEELSKVTNLHYDELNHTLVALRTCRHANAVSKLHGEVARNMWSHAHDICPITHITNSQNQSYWQDLKMAEHAKSHNLLGLKTRKRELKEAMVKEVANQTGRLFDPDVLTIVWARRFASYKRPDLILRQWDQFQELLRNTETPVQIIWAGKPYPQDFAAVDIFNHLTRLSKELPNMAVLVGYELALSRLLKCGADLWLNTPIVTREASGTSGMTAAMNGALNFSTFDGWICEFANDGENAFIIPPADSSLEPAARDDHDCQHFYQIMHEQILPSYYSNQQEWLKRMLKSIDDVTPAFGANRMADEYYQKLYKP